MTLLPPTAARARCGRLAGRAAAGLLALALLFAPALGLAPVLGTGASARAADAGAPTLDALAGCLAKQGRVEVPFREERLVQSVDEMLESTGTLIYEPPRTLIQVVEQPRRERAVVEGDRMSVFDASGQEVATFDLSQRPGLKAVFDAVRALIKGDADALRAVFAVTLSGREGGWSMTLKPSGEDVGYQLSRILIDGTGRPGADAACQVSTIDVRKRDGGRRVLHLRPGA